MQKLVWLMPFWTEIWHVVQNDENVTRCHQKHETSDSSVGSSYEDAALHTNCYGP